MVGILNYNTEGELSMATNVLIVEDQSMPRQLFEMLIESSSSYHVLYSIESAAFAPVYCDKYPIELVIMDVIMKDGSNGLEAAQKIKTAHPDIKIIIVTSMPEVSFIARAKEIGVNSFWYKEANTDTILEIMDRTMNGENVFPEKSPTVRLGNINSDELTNKEIEVLRYMTKGLSNQEIAERLFVEITTIKTHIKHMLQKTGFSNRTELAIQARIAGIVIGE